MDQLSDWGHGCGISREDAEEYLKSAVVRFVQPILREFRLDHSYCAVTGTAIAQFRPILILSGLSEAQVDVSINELSRWIKYRPKVPTGIQRVGSTLFLPIVGKGELFGFVASLDHHPADDGELRRKWNYAVGQIADFNYARRVIALAVPLANGMGEITESQFLQQVARTTALSFGADAAIIRIYNAEYDTLTVEAVEGDVTDEMISDRRRGEALSGVVLASNEQNWALVQSDGEKLTRGAPVPPSSIEFLKANGVRAAICARMDAPFLTSTSSPLGTITYVFRRASNFSWRDVALFVSFARRIADLLSLTRQAARLQERTKILEIQAPVFTQAELAHLLVHDLSHKVLDIEGEGRDLQDEVRKELRRYRSQISQELMDRFSKFETSIELLKKEVIDLRAVGRLQDKDDEIFSSKQFDAHKETLNVVQSMESVLNRQKITTHVINSGDTSLHGPEKVFRHVLLNFIINIVDAAKSRPSQRPMSANFTLIGDANTFRIRIWDTGPGIDMSKFQKGEEVFRIGKTTKQGGTGMGLPVARNLWERYFGGSIHLIDPKNALFELEIKR